jgi:hypothetical protein
MGPLTWLQGPLWRRHDPTGIHPENLDAMARAGTHASRVPASTHSVLPGSHSMRSPARCPANEPITGQVTDLHSCVLSPLHLQRREHRCQDQAPPVMDLKHTGRGTPPVVQGHMVCGYPEGQLPLPAAGRHTDHVRQRPLLGITHRAQRPSVLPMQPERTHAHRSAPGYLNGFPGRHET